jgi:hypothetical protein
MPNKKRKEKMVDTATIPKSGKFSSAKPVEPAAVKPEIAPKPVIDEEKVEVMIKESVMINPRDFSAFKHAAEEFFGSWSK